MLQIRTVYAFLAAPEQIVDFQVSMNHDKTGWTKYVNEIINKFGRGLNVDDKLFNGLETELSGEFLADSGNGKATPLAIPLVRNMLVIIRGEMGSKEIMQKLEIKNTKYFRENYLRQAIEMELIERTIPDKPSSPLQKYRLTDKGRQLLTSPADRS